MNHWQIALRSLIYYARTNFAIAFGVAAATAVLTGALIVGDSMRSSLRGLTLERLGKIDEMVVSDGFFREQLATDMQQTPTFQDSYSEATPAIVFPGGTVEFKADQQARRAGQVTVLGVRDAFWSFDPQQPEALPSLQGDSAIINQSLADDLQITPAEVANGTARITVRIPKRDQLPADSALGRKTDLIESLVDINVLKIIPTAGLGRFGMHPTQSDPLNIYVPIELLQDSLRRSVLKFKSDPAQANAIFVAAQGDKLPTAPTSESLRDEIRPTLEDYGLSLKRVTQTYTPSEGEAATVYDYWSLSSDQLVLSDEATTSIEAAFPNAKPVFTYLANDIRLAQSESGVPFSMTTGIDLDDAFPLVSAKTGKTIGALAENEIVINEWTAADLGLADFDPSKPIKLKLSFFEPETTHGSQTERTVELTLIDVAKLTAPDSGFEIRGRDRVIKPSYSSPPTYANDPDLTPEVPGVTDAATIASWELPFDTAGKMRSQDDDYWDEYRTTPKAFVSLQTAQQLWRSRFGQVTSYRIPVDTGDDQTISQRLSKQLVQDRARLGMQLVSIKRRGLAASSGSTPFDVLFLALSMFVIGAALILVSLLFRLGLQQRANELGLLKATGFTQPAVRRLWLREMLIVSFLGAVIGILLGVGYAALMIWGLSTWWVGAISRPFLTLSVSPLSLAIGLLSGLLICVLTIAWSLRRTKSQPIRSLLAGQLESPAHLGSKGKPWFLGLAFGLIAVAVGAAVMATQLSGESQAGSFMGAGFLILTALLMLVYRWLNQPDSTAAGLGLSLTKLASNSAKRNPLRSTLTIGLVAVASFLIAAVSSFRLTPNESGTAGFDWVAQSSQPIFEDLGTVAGQVKALGAGFELAPTTEVFSLRYKPGEDASCNNLYQSTQPRALGVPLNFVQSFSRKQVDRSGAGEFAWGGSSANSPAEQANPWLLLSSEQAHAGTADDPIPVVIDKNTANYSLKIYLLGTVKEVTYDSGESFFYRVDGFLANTILQGSLIMSEADFKQAFPAAAGYQYFLIRTPDQLAEAGGGQDLKQGVMAVSSDIAKLEDRLGDQGFDARSADVLLANFMSVQNTYLSTFQTLGALGLLLGTFGLAAVQVRSVLERKRELGLMRAVGFAKGKLSRMILLENAWLLLMGLGVGIAAALFTTVPHWFVGTASVPWLALAAIFGVIIAIGLLAGWLASRVISSMPLLQSLR